jgi:hypothetical protein
MGIGLPQPVAVVVLGGGMDIDEGKAGLIETLHKANARLEAHEKLSHIIVAKDPWTIENGLLTPTMKIKRHLLEKKYIELIATPNSDAVVMEQRDA